ncbi:helix-turn-helix domain-containing protein [Chelatococcus asaccharovorans]|uniref:helix-turn-helix domain-containing protein n=1 Tax=Chelatococcus asaccharovorans TaxID=28210 RepID=UPI00224C743C|nr:helix-turn-helix domain-containing protein [Chelatococcus asaccharovorans]CAH1661325.1 AraC family transcriptional regulator [Chelatococcus asaccharovorans]CAH1689854.1 AraC family transcriptional regulator [Chelatococcus asaccharovorans]
MPSKVSTANSNLSLTSREITIDGFEQLRMATPATNSEIIQLEAGRMQGRLKHANFAGLSLGFGTFTRGLLSRGIYSYELVTIGFLFDRSGQFRSQGISTIGIWSPGAEHERRYDGDTSFGGISVAVEDFVDFFGPNNRFGDPSAWRKPNIFRPDHESGAVAADALRRIMTSFDKRAIKLSQADAAFWKRAILEAATSVMAFSEPSDVFVASPTRLVRQAQEYVDRSGRAPVHLSELLAVLRVSRRSLHRAFDEVLGIPPMTYLRHKRLCEARILLKEDAGRSITVADVAFKQGFSDFGRFSGYYRSLFGENPSDTLRSTRLQTS